MVFEKSHKFFHAIPKNTFYYYNCLLFSVYHSDRYDYCDIHHSSKKIDRPQIIANDPDLILVKFHPRARFLKVQLPASPVWKPEPEKREERAPYSAA